MSVINNQTNAKVRLKFYNLQDKKHISLPPGPSRISFNNNLAQIESRFMLRIQHQTIKSAQMMLLQNHLYFIFIKSSVAAARLALKDLYIDVCSYPLQGTEVPLPPLLHESIRIDSESSTIDSESVASDSESIASDSESIASDSESIASDSESSTSEADSITTDPLTTESS